MFTINGPSEGYQGKDVRMTFVADDSQLGFSICCSLLGGLWMWLVTQEGEGAGRVCLLP